MAKPYSTLYTPTTGPFGSEEPTEDFWSALWSQSAQPTAPRAETAPVTVQSTQPAPYAQPEDDSWFTGAQAAGPAPTAPNPWDEAPFNGDMSAYLRAMSEGAHAAQNLADKQAYQQAYESALAAPGGEEAWAKVLREGQEKVARMRPAHESQSYQITGSDIFNGVGEYLDFDYSPYTPDNYSAEAFSRTSGPPARGTGTTTAGDIPGGVTPAQVTEQIARGQTAQDRAAQFANEEAQPDVTGALGDQTQANRDQFEQDRPDALDAAQRRRSMFEDYMAGLEGLELDPRVLMDRALAQQLAVASGAAGGGAARRAATAQALQNAPAVAVEAQLAAQQNALQVKENYLRALESLNQGEQEQYRMDLQAAENLFNSSQQMAQLGAQLEQQDRALVGGILRDLAQIATSAGLDLAQMSTQEAIAALQAETQRAGYANDMERTLTEIADRNSLGPKDYLNAVFSAAGILAMKG